MGSHDSFLRCSNLLNSSQNSGKHCAYNFRFIMKDIIKNKEIQPNEKVHRVKSGRVLSIGSFILMVLRCATLLAHGSIHQSASSLNHDLGILGGFLSSHGHDRLLT